MVILDGPIQPRHNSAEKMRPAWTAQNSGIVHEDPAHKPEVAGSSDDETAEVNRLAEA